MSFEQIHVGQMSVGQMSIGQISVGQMSPMPYVLIYVGKMSVMCFTKCVLVKCLLEKCLLEKCLNVFCPKVGNVNWTNICRLNGANVC